MVEASDNFLRLLPVHHSGSRGEQGQNGQTGLTSGDQFRKAPGFAGWVLFLAMAIAGMSALYVDSAVEQTALRRLAGQLVFDAAHYRYAAGGFSDSDVPARVSPDVAVLIDKHRAALAALTVAVPAAICR